jgi:RimJ/RimL family protein N-acetyltransferase
MAVSLWENARMSALVVVPFSAELLPLVDSFHCGDEPHERELADWIRQEAVPAMARGCNVWLYATPEKQIVGFGSLTTTRWSYPDPSSKRAAMALIPAVAIQTLFWGKPDGPREGRYSTQILDHLIVEAARLEGILPVLGLFVHPANQRAVKVYERAGFQPYTQTYTDKATGVIYSSMIRGLVRPND